MRAAAGWLVLSTYKPASPLSQGTIVHSAIRRGNGVGNCRRAEVQSSARLENVEVSILETENERALRKLSLLLRVLRWRSPVSISKFYCRSLTGNGYGAATLIS